MPATSGRVLSNVCMTPAKPRLGSISGLPSRFSLGTRQSSRRKLAVSEARIPSLCSSRSSFSPGLSRSTTNDLIAARPCLGSSVAQTTTSSARSPEVTKIFSPLRTYSSPSSFAVVRIAAESEPASGSVIAIAAHLPPNRLSCPSSATAAIAAWPRPWRGIVSSRPTSPQHSSVRPSRLAMLLPLRLALGSAFLALAPLPLPSPFPPTPPAPAPPSAPLSFMPSIAAASMSSSLG